jgi:hypothetical protein
MKREMTKGNWRENEQFVFELKESEEKIMKWNEEMTERAKNSRKQSILTIFKPDN